MSSVHDNNLYKNIIDNEKNELTLFTKYENQNTEVIFENLKAHEFVHGIENLKEKIKYRWPFPCKSIENDFINTLSDNNIHIFSIQSSYGLSGCVFPSSEKYVLNGVLQ